MAKLLINIKKVRFLPGDLSIIFLLVVAPMLGMCQNTKGLSKKLAIQGAQYANGSYTYSKMAYSIGNRFQRQNVDTAIFFLKEAIISLDSAILVADDSALLGKDFTTLAIKSAKSSLKRLEACFRYNADDRRQLLENATIFSANTVTDAYHASFYFKDGSPPVKETAPKKDTTAKLITKLDIDQALFTLLDEELIEKEEKNKHEISKLEASLKATKDPSKKNSLKTQIAKLQKDEAEVEKKDKETKEKLGKINIELEEREKNKLAMATADANAFAKSRPADNWDKQVLPESEIPMGLIYQVQIGVYKNPVTAETFKGITPIFSKTTPAGIAYSAGLFDKMEEASQAKDYVLSMGLHDAFVIVYHDRKRISLTEAAKLEKK
jgi:hypothetical protein